MTATTELPESPGALLSDRVFEAVKREIIECRLEPETVIGEGSLARRFNVSKAPVREALKRLSQLDLVRPVPRVGYIVASVRLTDIDEVYTLRRALEPLATKLATPRLTDSEFDALEASARVSAGLGETPPEVRRSLIGRANHEFHTLIAAACGNRRLEAAIRRYLEELERAIHLLADETVIDLVAAEHLELVGVLRGRDADAAAALMEEQLRHDWKLVRALAVEGRTGLGLGPR